jgi:hypothetical protein
MWSIWQSHDLGDLWNFIGVTIKVLDVSKNPWIQGFRSNCPGEASNTIYWPETLFSEGTTKSYKFSYLLAAISKVEGSSTVLRWSKEQRGQGAAALQGSRRATAATGCGRRRLLGHGHRGRRLSPLGRHLSIIIYITSSYPYHNLLENMMCGTIYYCFPIIYCIYV